MRRRDAFLIALLLLLTYTALTQQVFGRLDQTDKYYHINKSMNPLAGEYYAPLFHIIVWLVSLILPEMTALNLVTALLMFWLVPWSFNYAYNHLWNERKNTNFYYFFIPWFTVLTFIMNVWPQILSMLFMFLLLALMFRRANNWLILFVTIIGFFSHTAGGFWITLTTIFYFTLRDKRLAILLLVIVVIVMLVYPPIYTRPLRILEGFISQLDLNLERIIEVLLLWFNPLSLYLIYEGFKERKLGLNDYVIFFAVVSSFALAILDVELRPILNGMLLLGLYGFKGAEKHDDVRHFMILFGVYTWFVLVVGVLLM